MESISSNSQVAPSKEEQQQFSKEIDRCNKQVLKEAIIALVSQDGSLISKFRELFAKSAPPSTRGRRNSQPPPMKASDSPRRGGNERKVYQRRNSIGNMSSNFSKTDIAIRIHLFSNGGKGSGLAMMVPKTWDLLLDEAGKKLRYGQAVTKIYDYVSGNQLTQIDELQAGMKIIGIPDNQKFRHPSEGSGDNSRNNNRKSIGKGSTPRSNERNLNRSSEPRTPTKKPVKQAWAPKSPRSGELQITDIALAKPASATKRAISPAKRVSPTPTKTVIAPAKSVSPAPGKNAASASAPIKRVSPAPSKTVSPAPIKSVSPAPVKGVSPTKRVSPAPSKNVSPSPKSVSPAPVKSVSTAPIKAVVDTNVRKEVEEPKKEEVKKEEPKKEEPKIIESKKEEPKKEEPKVIEPKKEDVQVPKLEIPKLQIQGAPETQPLSPQQSKADQEVASVTKAQEIVKKSESTDSLSATSPILNGAAPTSPVRVLSPQEKEAEIKRNIEDRIMERVRMMKQSKQ